MDFLHFAQFVHFSFDIFFSRHLEGCIFTNYVTFSAINFHFKSSHATLKAFHIHPERDECNESSSHWTQSRIIKFFFRTLWWPLSTDTLKNFLSTTINRDRRSSKIEKLKKWKLASDLHGFCSRGLHKTLSKFSRAFGRRTHEKSLWLKTWHWIGRCSLSKATTVWCFSFYNFVDTSDLWKVPSLFGRIIFRLRRVIDSAQGVSCSVLWPKTRKAARLAVAAGSHWMMEWDEKLIGGLSRCYVTVWIICWFYQ